MHVPAQIVRGVIHQLSRYMGDATHATREGLVIYYWSTIYDLHIYTVFDARYHPPPPQQGRRVKFKRTAACVCVHSIHTYYIGKHIAYMVPHFALDQQLARKASQRFD